MEANVVKVGSVFSNGRVYRIPFYQRAYVWESDQLERFLDDMEFVSRTNCEYFLGAIIVKQVDVAMGDEIYGGLSDLRLVIDGQQRLTTIMVFLKVLSLKTGDDYDFKQLCLHRDKYVKMQHSKRDSKFFEQIMAKDNLEKFPNEEKSKLLNAFNYLVDNLNCEKINQAIVLNKLQLVAISLNSNDDEQQIFDAINSLGVRLTVADLLKNYFFDENQVEDYKKNWFNVFENSDDKLKYWEQLYEVGRFKLSLIDIFFDAYFRMFIFDNQYRVSAEDKIAYSRVGTLAKSYHDFINKYCDGNKNVILSKLVDYANCFFNNFNPAITSTDGMSKQASIERINFVIFELQNTSLIPYVLFVCKNVVDLDQRNAIFGVLESYIMRRMIAKHSTKNYNKMIDSLILNKILTVDELMRRLNSREDDTNTIPNNAELLEGFIYSKLTNKQTRGILYLIESAIRPENAATSLFCVEEYTLEHLMPKKWKSNWELVGDFDEEKRNEILLTLGNLAIIPKKLNKEISNGSWDKKLNGKDKKVGLKKCAAGLMTMEHVIDKTQWVESEIETRAKWLCEKAASIWVSPSDDLA